MLPEIATIYRENRDNVILFLCSRGYSAEDSEDITQELFLKVPSLLPSFRGESSLHTWICSIAYRIGANKRRSENRRMVNTAPIADFLENRPIDTGLIASLDKVIPADLRPVYDAIRAGLNGGQAEKEGIADRTTFMRYRKKIAAIARELAHM